MSPALALLALVAEEPAYWAWEQLWFPLEWLGPRRLRRRRRSREEMAAVRALQAAGREAKRLAQARVQRLRRKQRRIKWPRKCSTLPRARSISAKRLSRAERRDAEVLLFPGWDRDRPHTRGDCVDQPRPCPWVSCRYNLFLDVADNGTLKQNFPNRDPTEMPARGSCVLDIADRVAAGDAMSLQEVGQVMNLGIERVRQISSLALQGARVKVMWEERLHKVRVPPEARRR